MLRLHGRSHPTPNTTKKKVNHRVRLTPNTDLELVVVALHAHHLVHDLLVHLHLCLQLRLPELQLRVVLRRLPWVLVGMVRVFNISCSLSLHDIHR